MSNWKVTAFFYVEAGNEGEAWSKATLDLPQDSQITKLEEASA